MSSAATTIPALALEAIGSVPGQFVSPLKSSKEFAFQPGKSVGAVDPHASVTRIVSPFSVLSDAETETEGECAAHCETNKHCQDNALRIGIGFNTGQGLMRRQLGRGFAPLNPAH